MLIGYSIRKNGPVVTDNSGDEMCRGYRGWTEPRMRQRATGLEGLVDKRQPETDREDLSIRWLPLSKVLNVDMERRLPLCLMAA